MKRYSLLLILSTFFFQQALEASTGIPKNLTAVAFQYYTPEDIKLLIPMQGALCVLTKDEISLVVMSGGDCLFTYPDNSQIFKCADQSIMITHPTGYKKEIDRYGTVSYLNQCGSKTLSAPKDIDFDTILKKICCSSFKKG